MASILSQTCFHIPIIHRETIHFTHFYTELLFDREVVFFNDCSQMALSQYSSGFPFLFAAVLLKSLKATFLFTQTHLFI